MLKKNYDAVLLLSGGIDSTTMLYKLVKEDRSVMCLIFDYGQTLIKEVDVAVNNATRLGQDYRVIHIDLSFAGSACTLISDNPISVRRSFQEIESGIPSSYVEFRNGILLSYAVMFAEVNNVPLICGGFNGLYSGKYYDDTYEFIKAYERAANAGTKPGYHVTIDAPFSKVPKSEIVRLGMELGIDYDRYTWSCYKNGETPCGQCDSCKQRERALRDGGYTGNV